MKLERYLPLIQNLPYLDQAFETKQTNWQKECEEDNQFKHFCQKVFIESSLKISRQDLFSAALVDGYTAIILIIFWGYPRNMRGNNFKNILKSISVIQKLLPLNKEWTKDEFLEVSKSLKGKSIGLSTFTKILYFFKIKIDGKNCLILDQRIIQVLNSGLYKDLASLQIINEYNKLELYFEYLQRMNDVANTLNVTPDQLEYFLFHFGKNLKKSSLEKFEL